MTSERRFRRNLPHIQIAGSTYFLTWHCRQGITLSPADRSITLSAIRHWHGVKWDVIAAVVMPDHVHVLATPFPKGEGVHDLSEILHSIKSFSAHQVNKASGRKGPVWLDETYDRIVRDEAELEEKYDYIRNNPVKKGLVATVAEYPWLIDQEEHRPEEREEHRRDAGATATVGQAHGGTGVPPVSTGSPPTISLLGPFSSLERFLAGVKRPPVTFPASDVLGWTDTAALPLLPAEDSAAVFAQIRKAPRLDFKADGHWRARPYRELDATNDKKLMKLVEEQPEGYWPVFKGETFDIWEPDRGIYYAWADPEKMIKHLQKKRDTSRRNSKSVFFEFTDSNWFRNPDTLPCHFARIAFRDVSRATDSRTVRLALLPPKCFVTNQAPFLLWVRGDERDQAFLLGILASVPMDWYARRFVETHLNFHVVNPFPIPRPARDNPLWQRTVALAGRLACPDKRFAKWAKAVGVECGKLDAAEKDDMIAELDAVVAHLYGLSESHLTHIFETFHEGWDYQPRLRAVLAHYKAWAGKL